MVEFQFNQLKEENYEIIKSRTKRNEKPAALDKEGKIRDISSHVKDLNPDHVNFETISKLQSVDLSSLTRIIFK